jgi:hypothetical protein
MKITVAGLFLIVLSGTMSVAAPEQSSSTVSACGSLHTNATVNTVCAVAQPGTAGVSRNSRYTHYSGFIGGAFIRPGTTNAQGVALEATPDNDDDGLLDSDEISGAAFGGHASTDPNRADTDRDGMSDADEAAGMYDPNDPDHRLAILDLTDAGDNLTLKWVGKGGGTANTVLWNDNIMSGPPSNVLHTAPYAGGTTPWFKSTNEHTWAEAAATTRYFRVETE